MKNMKTKQSGFTLIELMIVVAIIGILAAVAIPAYQDYIGRAQMAEPISFGGAAKTPIEEFVATNGAFPVDTSLTQLIEISRASSILSMTGTPGTNGDGDGSFTFELAASGLNNGLLSQTVTFTRSSGGQWSCASTASDKLMPTGCTGI
jgi:type IV pilus assembly protein PilA